jgi:hypothetical protein
LEKQGKLKNVMRSPRPVSLSHWRPHRALRLRGCVFFTLSMALHVGFDFQAHAQQGRPEEYQVKAAYLYNFGRFVEWPATAVNNKPFTICVLGHDPFGAVLDNTLIGESINNRKLEARRIASAREADGCEILFVSSSEAARTKEILAAVEKFGPLTVSDMPNFVTNGGMIQFLLVDNKVRFEVSLKPAQKAGLNFSSQLLKVATSIRKESRLESGNP